MTSFQFSKYEGLGNDFLIVPGLSFDDARRLAPLLCDRNFGVGADGILVLEDELTLVPRMRVVNADASVAEMCGNGIRCVALHVRGDESQEEISKEMVIETDAGPHFVQLLHSIETQRGRKTNVRVQMRKGSLLDSAQSFREKRPFVEDFLSGAHASGTFVSMGNPHFVIFDTSESAREELVELFSHHPAFEHGVNIGFAEVDEQGDLQLRVYERGVGYTLACGTGACAAAIAAVETKRMNAEKPILVNLPGGALAVDLKRTVDEYEWEVWMTGPARKVFEGSVEIA